MGRGTILRLVSMVTIDEQLTEVGVVSGNIRK